MPSLKHIRRRIASVKSTRQITRAMKLVAAAKLRRAQERLVQLRPYASRVARMIAELASGTDADDHPLLAQRPPKRTLLLLLTSDRGQAGAFNSNVNKAALRWMIEHKAERDHIELRVVGRKGRDFFRARKVEIGHVYADVLNQVTLARATGIGREVVAAYVDGNFDEVYVVCNVFKSAISQNARIERLLPLQPEDHDHDPTTLDDTLFEPSKKAVLDAILPMDIHVQIYRYLLESVASEMGARMTAMDAATKNADDLMSRLTLQYNRARQSIITTELTEITSGAEALKG